MHLKWNNVFCHEKACSNLSWVQGVFCWTVNKNSLKWKQNSCSSSLNLPLKFKELEAFWADGSGWYLLEQGFPTKDIAKPQYKKEATTQQQNPKWLGRNVSHSSLPVQMAAPSRILIYSLQFQRWKWKCRVARIRMQGTRGAKHCWTMQRIDDAIPNNIGRFCPRDKLSL